MYTNWIAATLAVAFMALAALAIASRLVFLLAGVSCAFLAAIAVAFHRMCAMRLFHNLQVTPIDNPGQDLPTQSTAMATRIEQSSDVIRVIPGGDIDHEEAEGLKNAVAGLSLQSTKAVIFDLRNVKYIGSAGLGKFLLFYKRLSSQKIKMEIESAAPSMIALFKELRLDTLFNIH
jgi:anti-sigma B factor antagonist